MNCKDKIKILVSLGIFIFSIFIIKFYLDNNDSNKENNKQNNNELNKNINEEYLGINKLNQCELDKLNYYNTPIVSNLDLRKNDSMEQVYNPLRYPSQSPPYYNSTWYPSFNLPPNVVECNGRREPCFGGSQIVIPNKYPTRIITNDNISPINIRTRGPEGEPQQVGTLYNLNSREQDVYPLFGRKRFPNDNKWEYYTIIGNYGAKIPVKPLRNYQEIGTNDILQLVNYPGNFKATIYKREDLQYIPYV